MDHNDTTHADRDYAPTRTRQRRAALEVLALAERLVVVPENRLNRMELPEDVLREIANTRRITSHVARKRQLGYLAKIMRKYDDDAFIKTRAELGEDRAQMRRETAAMHRLEDWRERLVGDDAALEALIEEHPDVDRQHLRSLVRQARHEKDNNKPPRAFREIFQLLKQLPSNPAGE